MTFVVVVGSGATGVELAGALAEMKKFVLPRDYPDLDANLMRIVVVSSSSCLLPAFKEKSSKEGCRLPDFSKKSNFCLIPELKIFRTAS